MHRSILCLLTLIMPLTATAQVTVVDGHPRIYLRPDDLTDLRARAATAAIAPYYQQLKTRMDGTSNRHGNDEVAGFEMQSLALCHIIEASGDTYRDKILNTWLLSGYSGGMSHWDLPFQVMAHSLALDWMWDDLSAGQRTTLGNTIVALMDDLHDYAAHDSPYANQMSDYSNQLYYHLGSLAFAGIVLAGEGIADDTANGYLDEADTLLHDHMIPAMSQEAGGDAELHLTSGFAGNGGWGEDMGHTAMTHPFLGRMLEAWRTGTGEDLYSRTNGIATIAKYMVYMTRPNGEFSPKGNGEYGNRPGDKHDGSLGCLTSARYGDAYGKLIKDRAYAGTTYGFHQLAAVLWYDHGLADLQLASLPGTSHFQGQGEVVMRSGFGSDDTWVYLRSGPIYNGHQHDDQGNLLIEAYGGELLVERAGNGEDATVNHNTIRVGGDQVPYGNNEIQYVAPIAGTPQERGRVTEVQEGADFTYVATDFSNAFDDAHVAPPNSGKVTREVVVILPDLVVVRDRVTGTGTVEVLWHAWSGGVTSGAGAQTFAVTAGSGHAWARALLPANATLATSTVGDTDMVTVTATVPQTTEVFLHVFHLAPSASPFAPTDLALIDETSEEGAQLTDATGDHWQVRFTKGGVGLTEVIRNGTPVETDGGPTSDGASPTDGALGDPTAGDALTPGDAAANTPGSVTGGCSCGAAWSSPVLLLVPVALWRRRSSRNARA